MSKAALLRHNFYLIQANVVCHSQPPSYPHVIGCGLRVPLSTILQPYSVLEATVLLSTMDVPTGCELGSPGPCAKGSTLPVSNTILPSGSLMVSRGT